MLKTLTSLLAFVRRYVHQPSTKETEEFHFWSHSFVTLKWLCSKFHTNLKGKTMTEVSAPCETVTTFQQFLKSAVNDSDIFD
jgi:hypothetical protein